MVTVESQLLRVIESLVVLGEMADASGAHALCGSTYASIVMLADSATEDGVQVDFEGLGIGGA